MAVDKRVDQFNLAVVPLALTDIFPVVQGPGTAALQCTLADIRDGALQLPVSNTVFVDESFGSDSTGLAERADLPFLTKAAASIAAAALTPSATKRISISVKNFNSAEGIVLGNFIDWDLNGGSIDLAAGALAAIDDNNIACNSVIYNAHTIQRTTAGTNGHAIRLQNAGSVVTVYANNFNSNLLNTILLTNGTLTTYGTVNTTNGTPIQVQAGILVSNGNIVSTSGGILISAGTATLNGNITNSAGQAITNTGGTITMNGNINASSNAANIVISAGSTILNGNSTNTLGICGTTAGSGNLTVNGNTTSGSNASAHGYQLGSTGRCVFNGDISSSAAGAVAVNNIGAAVGGQIIVNGGTITSTLFVPVINFGSGVLILNSCRVITPAAATEAIRKDFASTLILNSTTLIAGAGANSINSVTAENVHVYGTSVANLAINGNTTILVGTLVVDAAVV